MASEAHTGATTASTSLGAAAPTATAMTTLQHISTAIPRIPLTPPSIGATSLPTDAVLPYHDSSNQVTMSAQNHDRQGSQVTQEQSGLNGAGDGTAGPSNSSPIGANAGSLDTPRRTQQTHDGLATSPISEASSPGNALTGQICR